MRVSRLGRLDRGFVNQFISVLDLVDSHPREAVVGFRRLLGDVVTELLTRNLQRFRSDLNGNIVFLQKQGLVPNAVASQMHTIRTLGNTGAHPDEYVLRKEDVLTAVMAMAAILEWLDAQ